LRSSTVSKPVLVVQGRAISAEAVAALVSGLGGGGVTDADLTARVAAVLRSSGLDARHADESDIDSVSPDGPSQAEVLLDAIGEGVCLVDPRGRVLWENRYFATLEPELRARAEERLREASVGFAQMASNEVRHPRRYTLSSADERSWYELLVAPAPARPTVGGDIGERESDRAAADDRAARIGSERVVGVLRDVTAAHRSEAKLHAIDRAGFEIVRMDADAVRQKSAYERLQLLEEKVVRLAHDVLEYDHFAIFLIDEPRQRLELVISAGLPPEIQDLDLSPEVEGSGISGYVAATGEAYICHDATTDERFLPGLTGARSSMTLPLRLQDRVIGILDIESKEPNAFDEGEQRFAEIFGRHLALALHMLDLLVVERSTTNQAISGRVGDELRGPLDDICDECQMLEESGTTTPSMAAHLAKIREDVASIRDRLESVSQGPKSLIGVERAMAHVGVDPILGGKRVLVADDEPRIRKIVSGVMRARGCEVSVCESGADAIVLLEESVGKDQPYDLIVSDIRMPDRNGYEVFAASRQHCPDAAVILMTGFGYDPHHSIVRASQQGLHSVLFKPFDIERLLEEARNALQPAE
jgi:CheY-like chemotaxis protein/putative methionine-R-sulfoxide reductase with GAF domain/PAS domain-containing protein